MQGFGRDKAESFRLPKDANSPIWRVPWWFWGDVSLIFCENNVGCQAEFSKKMWKPKKRKGFPEERFIKQIPTQILTCPPKRNHFKREISSSKHHFSGDLWIFREGLARFIGIHDPSSVKKYPQGHGRLKASTVVKIIISKLPHPNLELTPQTSSCKRFFEVRSCNGTCNSLICAQPT